MKISRWLRDNASSLVGKTVAVTGTTGGLGMPLCKTLAFLGANLILCDRNPQKSAAFRDELQSAYPAVTVACVPLDLEDIASVESAILRLRVLQPDVLIHNAGAYSIPRHTCESGYDNVFQINFVSPYTITRALLPMLRQRGGCVVAVGSIAHHYSHSDPADVDFASRRAASKVYGNAKRYWMFSLYDLFAEETKASLAVVHPGITFTNITAHYPKWLFAIIKHPMKVIFMRPSKACLSVVRGVFDPCGYHEWIGPRLFDVWGLPKKRRLHSCKEAECRHIIDAAQEAYARMNALFKEETI